MKVCVFGLWHLGCVTAACVAEHHQVTGLDPDSSNIGRLNAGEAPVFEPGLNELIRAGIEKGALRFSSDVSEAAAAEIVWVTFDTPVDDKDQADFEYVERQIESLFPHLRAGATLLISSQLPVGSTSRIARRYRGGYPADVAFAYSPENLRLGKALAVFRNPGRIVVGAEQTGRERLAAFLETICPNMVWMSVESAEMTKHALNAFLANSVAFMNEIARICEQTGADAKQVEQGLKTDERIGPRAYLSPGGAFAGGTLARDVVFLARRAAQNGVSAPLLSSILESNEFHKSWPLRTVEGLLGTLAGKRIAVLGLTYKPGTDTLRRSAAVELSRELRERGGSVQAFDPAVREIPQNLDVKLCASAAEALRGSDAAVVATEWPEFRKLVRADFLDNMNTPNLVDANRFLEAGLDCSPPLRYVGVGKGMPCS